MVTKLTPKLNEVYFIKKYTILHILKGTGAIQVDFKNYFNWEDKIIFLEKGQYIKFLSEDFIVRQIYIDDEVIFKNKEVRVLFKHLVSLGYINFLECKDCQKYLSETVLTAPKDIIDISARHWYWQNPFNANTDEYHIIFDTKDIIDKQYKNHLSNVDLSNLIKHEKINPQALIKGKIGITIKNLIGNKRLTESKKAIAFSDNSIKEIAYEFGYRDPAYFNRVFKQNTGTTPSAFRNAIDFEQQDRFIQDLYELLQDFHSTKRNVSFYAQKFHLSEKAFSKKVKDRFHISIGQLIRQQLIKSAKKDLQQGYQVHEISTRLGFEEPNHFSTFFKHNTGITPTAYQKYNQ
tara:strand:+ start:9215 stop:10258 length:1044 start_codon:yes stop_codon:yes gene_type:complete